VVGVDMVQSAIEDARHNCRLNNVTNCEHVAGKVSARGEVLYVSPSTHENEITFSSFLPL
jgi:tRNA/tmRNA/rRNA uracil-C5-methylase (TrmA/RlmC/RlmD family)